MKKLIIGLLCGGLATGLCAVPAAALEADCTEDMSTTDCEAYVEELNEEWESSAVYRNHLSDAQASPTFSATWDNNKESAGLWAGQNLLIAGNNLATDASAPRGLLLVAGNTLNLSTTGEYSFVAGNVINFAGATLRDLYIAGNMVTLEQNAEIGRDVFAAGSVLTIKSNLAGNLAATADRVVLKGVHITGNVDLSASEIVLESGATIDGTLTYNDNAVVNGLNSNGVKVGQVETYHVEEISDNAMLWGEIYGKILSIAGLFLAMAVVLALCPKVHQTISAHATAAGFGKNLVFGLCALIGIPVVVFAALCTIVAAPLALALLAIYIIMIYLSQGFAGLWLGHILVEKVFKAKGNAYLEALLGIAVLGLLALVPYVGVITGLLGLLFGLGAIISSGKPGKTNSTEITEAEVVKKPRAKATKTTKTTKTAATKTAKKPTAKKPAAKSGAKSGAKKA